jgi:hypothetical protein
MIVTILNLFALFVATCAVMIFIVVFSFFMFIMYACIHIGWKEIKGMPLSALWEKIKKE